MAAAAGPSCGGAHAPENTLAGLALAARLGCRAVEFDVMLSRDKIPVLIHDETLMRTAGLPGLVADLNAAQLLATDVGRQFHPAFGGEMIPTLGAALAACRELGLAANVEIKPAAGFEAETGRVVGALLQAMPEAARPDVLLSSFSTEALQAAVLRAPGLPRAWATWASSWMRRRTATSVWWAPTPCMAGDQRESAHLVRLKVSPEGQGQGVGRSIMNHFLRQCP